MDDDGTLTERDRSDLYDSLDANPNAMAFSITPHPTLAHTVFVTSFNECSGWYGTPDMGCWGNARIDRYTFTAHEVTHDGLAFRMQAPLMLASPVYDDVAGVHTLTIRHDGGSDVTLDAVDVPDLPDDGAAFTTTCTGLTLTEGDTCTVEITEGTTILDNFGIEITTPEGSAGASYYLDIDNEQEYWVVTGFEFDYDLPGLPPCADNRYDPFQNGLCAPTALAFSADGTRAYVNDDNEDAVVVFDVDAAGDLTFLEVGDGVDLQGIAVHPDGTALYNGSNVYEIDGQTVEDVQSGVGGNATEVVVDPTGAERLVTTIDNASLEIWDADTDPLAPTLIASIEPPQGRARYQDHTDDLGLFVTIDHEQIDTHTFDGTDLTAGSSLDVPLDPEPTGCDPCDFQAVFRSVAVVGDGAHAVASAFVNPWDLDTANGLPWWGRLATFSIDPTTREVTEASTLDLDGGSRIVIPVDTP